MLGISFAQRVFLVFGDGRNTLPLVHVDNTVDAIVECIRNSTADNEIFNLVDSGLIAKKTYMDALVKPMNPGAFVIYFPMKLLIALTWLQEKLLVSVGRRPYLSVYRLLSSQKRITYATSKIEKAVGWQSRIGFEEGARQIISKR